MLYTDHSRSFKDNKYVYPVLSRRSKGISIGINLNPDKVCNFNCVYCQVDRRDNTGEQRDYKGLSVSLQTLCKELKETLEIASNGGIFLIPPFDKVPYELRHLSDIAISGDGEPTLFAGFYDVVEGIIKARDGSGHPPHFREDIEDTGSVPIVLITNSSGVNRSGVQDAIDLIYKNNGEVWLKLDAGEEDLYKKVSGGNIPFRVIIENIKCAARRHPVVIQSCFFRIKDSTLPVGEIEEYCLRLKEIIESGGVIRLIQLYTVARPPREDCVSPLSINELNFIAGKVRDIACLPAEVYP